MFGLHKDVILYFGEGYTVLKVVVFSNGSHNQ
jgi:hypothetical protein